MKELIEKERVEAVLDQYVRPVLKEHLGGVVITRIDGAVVFIKLLGQCSSCASAYYTVDELILKELKEHIPAVADVVIDTGDKELLQMAKKLLRHERSPEELDGF